MVDMHIHTNNSDGQYSTKEIVKKLEILDTEMFSITDHDNIKSCTEMKNIDLPKKMKYIPGVEFSSINGIYNCHILGYNFDYNNTELIKTCENISERRLEKIKRIINHLENERDIEFTEKELKNLYKKQTLGRYDVCKILMKKGYGTKPEIYDNYLTGIKGIKTHRIEIENVTQTIKSANGISILAHPKEIEEKYEVDIEEIIKDFIEKGIDGIEVYNTIHTLKDMRRYLLLAKKYNLLITGGSDFHGNSHPEREIGKTLLYKVTLNSSNLKLH
jgi:hypothetical protein